MIHARLDPKLKKSAERILETLGMTTTEAIRLFLRQVEMHNGLPFPVSVPNEATLAAMQAANRPENLKKYGSFRELRNRV
ncbi:MAG: type II toxin-antitoxin system RelB/DinJ family antitoxin [Acidobacteriota bacterium]